VSDKSKITTDIGIPLTTEALEKTQAFLDALPSGTIITYSTPYYRNNFCYDMWLKAFSEIWLLEEDDCWDGV